MHDAATQTLINNFTGWTVNVTCSGKNLTLVYDFANLKRK
jgi:hypothetical protein